MTRRYTISLSPVRYFTLSILLCVLAGPANGQSPWLRSTGPEGGTVNAIFDASGVLYAAVGDFGHGDLFRSTDHGDHWTSVGESIPNNEIVISVAKVDSFLFAGTTRGLYRTTNEGKDWIAMSGALPDGRIEVVNVEHLGGQTEIIAAGSINGVYHSLDNGETWSSLGLTLPMPRQIHAVLRNGPVLLVTTQGLGVYRTSNNGATWEAANEGLPSGDDLYTQALTSFHGKTFLATLRAVYVSTDLGLSWTVAQQGIPTQVGPEDFATDGVNLYTNAYGYGIYRSTNDGASWTKQNGTLGDYLSAHSLLYHDGHFYVGVGRSGIYRTTTNDTTWENRSSGIANTSVYSIRKLDASSDRLFAGTLDADFGLGWSSVDNARTWQPLTITDRGIHDFARFNDYLFAATDGEGIYRSSDDGASWKALTSLPNGATYITTLLRTPTSLLAGSTGFGVGVARSIDGGETWNVGEGKSASTTRLYYDSVSHRVFATLNIGLASSTDDGVSWTSIPTFDLIQIMDIVRAGSTLYAAGRIGLYTSVDNGDTWSAVDDPEVSSAQIHTLGSTNGTLYLGRKNEVLYRKSGDAGWSILGTGLPPSTTIESILIVGDTMYIGTESYGVWSIALPGSSASVRPATPLHSMFEVTSRGGHLVYASQLASEVSLEVSDVTGRVLYQQYHASASGRLSDLTLSSGLYFVQFTEQGGGRTVVRVLISE